MTWYKNHTIVCYASTGFLAGFAFPLFGFFLEFNMGHLPYTLESFLSIQQTQPLIWIIELAPLVLGFAAGLAGQQRSYSITISQVKKEWETTFDAFSDPVFITNKDGFIIRCNHAVLDRLNSTSIKVLGRQLTDVISEGQEENTGVVNYSGSEISWFKHVYETTVCPIYVEGMPENIICILHDVTSRKQAEIEVEESEILFRALFDRSPDAVILIDPHDPNVSWPIIDCNTAACLMNGYSREELIGQSIDILNLTSGTQTERVEYLKQLREAGNLKIETYHHSKNGLMFPVDVSTSLIAVGERELIIGIDRDITEQVQANEQLRKLSRAVEQSGSTIVISDIDGNIEYANKKFTETTGYTIEEAIGQNPRVLKSGYTSAEEYKHLWETIMAGKEWRGEFHNRKKNGDLYWESAIISPIFNEDEKITHFLAVKEDITARKEAMAALNASEAEMRALFSAMLDVIIVYNSEGRYLKIAPTNQSKLSHPPADLLGKTVTELFRLIR